MMYINADNERAAGTLFSKFVNNLLISKMHFFKVL